MCRNTSRSRTPISYILIKASTFLRQASDSASCLVALAVAEMGVSLYSALEA